MIIVAGTGLIVLLILGREIDQLKARVKKLELKAETPESQP